MIATGVIAALALGMLIARGSVSEAQTGYESPPSGGGATPPQFRVRVFDGNQSPQAETPVKTFAGLRNNDPAIAMDDNGNFVVASTTVDTGGLSNVHAGRFSAAGAQLGDTIVVPPGPDTFPGGRIASKDDPSVASDGIGNFVITYTDERSEASTGVAVAATMYKSDGTLVKSFDISTRAKNSSVARNSAGRFVVAYQAFAGSNSTDIRLNRYDAAGNLLGKVDIAATTLSETAPSVAIDTAGNSVVTWQVQQVVGNTKTDIRAQKVTKDGKFQTGVVTVAGTALEEQRPVVAMDRADGDYVIAYEVVGKGVSVAELSSAGVFRATHDLGAGIRGPAISMDGRGRYLVTYVPNSSDRGPAIFARYGIASVGPEIRVNTGEARAGGSTAANASAANGRSVVVWTSDAGTDIDSPLELKFEGQDVSVTGPLTCAAGNQWTINAVVTQGDSSAEGRSVGMCGGAVQEWRVRVAGEATGTFDPGAARVCARLSAKDPSGQETQRRDWCADVELVSAAATAAAADDDDILSIVALIVGALALILGGAALVRSRRSA